MRHLIGKTCLIPSTGEIVLFSKIEKGSLIGVNTQTKEKISLSKKNSKEVKNVSCGILQTFDVFNGETAVVLDSMSNTLTVKLTKGSLPFDIHKSEIKLF